MIDQQKFFFWKLVSYFINEKSETSSNIIERSNYRILVGTLIVTIITLSFFGLMNINANNHKTAVFIFCCVVINSSALVFYKKTGNYLTTATIFVMTMGQLLSYLQAHAPITFFTNFVYMPLVAIFAVMLLGEKRGFIVCAITGFTMGIGYLLPKFIEIKPDNFSDTDVLVFNSVTVFTSFAFYYVVIRIFLRQKNNAIETVDEQREKLYFLNERNKSLVSVLSHDLANPLFVIKILTRKLLKGNISESGNELKEISTKIDLTAATMEHIIDNIRSLQAFELGKLNLERFPVDLDETTRESIKMFDEMARTKGVKFDLTVDESANKMVLAEKSSLKSSIICNILSNALKFSPRSGIIKVEIYNENGQTALRITDNGSGIPDEILHNLFKLDVSTSRLGTSGELGTGFGMPIMKLFVDEFKINLDIKTNTDVHSGPTGTCFTLVFEAA